MTSLISFHSDLHSLAKYREQMGVTTAEHDQALNTLGWSEALLQIAVQVCRSRHYFPIGK